MNDAADHNLLVGIAIVGMAGRFPGAKNIEEFWRNLRDGVESIATLSDEELLAAGVKPASLNDPSYVKAAGILDGIEMFDGPFFGFNPHEAEITDPQHRLFLECAWEAMEAAGYDPSRYEGRCGVYAGAGLNTYLLSNLISHVNFADNPDLFQILIGNDKDHLATRVSYKLNLKGPSFTVQTACSTSLVAVHLACQSLLNYHCDLALAGGVRITVPQKMGYRYQVAGINSPDGHCRPFDAQANGTIGGNGVGLVLLKRLDDALADGDIVHAIIKGSAINNDGSLKVGYTAPSLNGQSEVIVEAQGLAGVSAGSVSYVEAHGTATALGDPIEVAALTQAFRASTSRSQFCALGSVKSNVGHLDSAAGVAGLIKTVLALKHRELPPSLHYTAPNPEIDFVSSPFYVNHELRAWETTGSEPRRAGVSSFGIGGTNAHVVVEEAPRLRAAAPSARGWHLLVLSGRTTAAVQAATEKLRRHLEAHPDISLADVAYTLQVGRREFAQRRAVVCRDVADAIEALSEPTRWIDGPVELAAGSQGAGSGRGVVLMYSGQGAQYAGMGRDLYEREAIFRQTVDQCAAAFKVDQGYDLREVLYPEAGNEAEAEARLLETEVTQPALFVLEYALTRLWQAWGLRIEALMGHSLGEYVAACVAGVLSVEDAVRMVGRRGRLMQGMERGSMLAARLSEGEVEEWLRDKQLWVAAVNGPQQCVLSGSESAITATEQQLTALGVGVKRLETSHGFHSGLMREAAQELGREMEGVARGQISIPYISNLSGNWAEAEEVRSGEYWGRQMLEPVQWWRGVEEVIKSGASVLLEVGPGASLSRVVQEAVRGQDVAVLSTLRGRRRAGEEAERGMVTSLGEMWVRGVGVKWGGMYAGEERRRVELPTYEFERERYWVEPRVDRSSGSNGDREEEAHRERAKIERWMYVPVWKQSVGQRRQSTSEASGRKWLVLSEESGLSEELVARLEAVGADVVSVRRGAGHEREGVKRYVIKGESRAEYERLVEELEEQGWRAERVVHLWSVTRDGDDMEFESIQERGFYSLLFLAQALGKQVLAESLDERKNADRLQITVVSNNMQSVNGEEELQPEKATVLGPCRVIGQEYPHINCRSIDVVLHGPGPDQRAVIVRQLLDELLSENAERIAAYRGRYRWVQTYEHVKLDRGERGALPVRLREHGVYVITGGLGGVGLVLAEHLVEVAQAKLVLIGRSAFPKRVEWEQWLESHDENDAVSMKIRKLQRLEEKGGEVFVIRADVADPEQMQKVWAQARGLFGPLHGVIHAAGNPPEGLIQLKSREKAAEILSPKVRGTMVLDSLCRDEGVDFIVLCSSISSILALPGRIDYCAANAFLDAYAHSKNAEGDPFTVSINWDGWEALGMAANADLNSDTFNREYSVAGMLPSEGVDVFDRILSGDLPQVAVSVEDLPARVRRHDAITAESSLEQLKHQRTISPAHGRPNLRNEYVAPRNEVELVIATIWQTLLGIDRIGVEDNFFELGGDSILSIQIIARANQAGVQLTPKQVFEHQTIAELAAIAGKGKTIAVEQGMVSGEAPLTPLQRWLFEQQTEDVNHYNQALMLKVRQRLDLTMLKQVIARLLEHHDALRLRFDRRDGDWRQWHVGREDGASEEVFKYINLGAVSETEQTAAITAAAEEVQRSLNLAAGPVLRIALMDLGEGREGRLLIVIHHLVVDAISWRILLEDLQRGYDQLQRGEPVTFQAKTLSYKNWAEALSKQSQTEEVRRELDYWLEATHQVATVLPVDHEQGLNTMEFQRSVDVKLDAELTGQLLQDVPATFNTQINEVLLTALVCAFERWSGGSTSLLVSVEGHGREEIGEGVDVSRTVGWFTTIFPVLLEARVKEDLGETLARTKERLRAVPRRGIGYGMLKYLNTDPSVFNQLRKTVNPQVSFLYLGQFDQLQAELELFTEAEESHGMDHSGAIRRPHLIDFSAYVADGQLVIKLAYSEQVHERKTIERLAQTYLEALRNLITFCLSSERTHFTASDFSDYGWDQQDLDAILAKIDAF